MRIDKDLCKKCGKCITECHNFAISKNEKGEYFIDLTKCKNCTDVFDVECVRACPFKAITTDDGSPIEYDTTWRLRSEHVIWFMAIIGSRSNKEHYPTGEHWDAHRKLIAAAYLNPDLKVRLTKYFDDHCIGCELRQNHCSTEHCGLMDDRCYEQLGMEPGTIINIWDFVKIAEEKFTIDFLKNLGSVSDETLADYIAFLPPDAEVLK